MLVRRGGRSGAEEVQAGASGCGRAAVGSPPHRSQIPFVCRCRARVWVKGEAGSTAEEKERWFCRQHIELCGGLLDEGARRIRYRILGRGAVECLVIWV
jgi:hypothetical protein